MSPAIYDTLRVDIDGNGKGHSYLLRVSGSAIKFSGFLAVYDRNNNGKARQAEENVKRIPVDIAKGQAQDLVELIPAQHFTTPPPRYSEASLVSVLEEYGIGRPSTYAPTMGTLQQRGYVVKEERRLVPAEIGKTVNDLVVEYFPNIVDVEFTANMEAHLDLVASGERSWVDVVSEFYGPFSKRIEYAKEKMPDVKPALESIGRECPKCGHDLVVRWGRHGKFIGCIDFPKCRHTEPLLEKIGVTCPEDGGDIVRRRTRRGRVFFGCSNYPECEFSSWKQPLPMPCPKCGSLLLTKNKNMAICHKCEEEFLIDNIAAKNKS